MLYTYMRNGGGLGGGGALLGVVSGGISTGNVRAATEVAFRVAVCSKIKDLFKWCIALLFLLSHRWHFGREVTFEVVRFGHKEGCIIAL